ncbi:unnamed protein product, partial [Laminaria digitata]
MTEGDGAKRHSCREFACPRRARYGTPGWLPAHCVEHRRDWEVFLKYASCLSEGCTERPRYGVPGDRSRVYCARHRVPGVVGLASVGWNFPDGPRGGWVEAEEDGMGVPVDSEADEAAELEFRAAVAAAAAAVAAAAAAAAAAAEDDDDENVDGDDDANPYLKEEEEEEKAGGRG